MNETEKRYLSYDEVGLFLSSGKLLFVECGFWEAKSTISLMPNAARTVTIKSGGKLCHCALSGYGSLWKACETTGD